MAAPPPEEMTQAEMLANLASEVERITLDAERTAAEYTAGVHEFAARTQARPFTQFWSVSTVDAPYRLAAAAGDAGRLAELLRQGMNPDYPDDSCVVPPLLLACDFGIGDEKPTPGHIECVELLLGAGASPHVTTYGAELTPLHLACIGSSRAVDMVRLLLDAGAEVNALGLDNSTPLMFACGLNCAHPDTIEALLAAGAAVDARRASRSSLQMLMCYGSMDR